MRRARDAGARSVTPIALHLRSGVREVFMDWLEDERPELRRALRRALRAAAPTRRRTSAAGSRRWCAGARPAHRARFTERRPRAAAPRSRARSRQARGAGAPVLRPATASARSRAVRARGPRAPCSRQRRDRAQRLSAWRSSNSSASRSPPLSRLAHAAKSGARLARLRADAEHARRDGDLAAVAHDRADHRVGDLAAGVRVPIPRGSLIVGVARTCPASRMKPGRTSETPTPLPRELRAQREREAAQAELRRAVDRGPGRRRLPRERADEDELRRGGAPASPAASACASAIGRAQVDLERAVDVDRARASAGAPTPAAPRRRSARRSRRPPRASALDLRALGEIRDDRARARAPPRARRAPRRGGRSAISCAPLAREPPREHGAEAAGRPRQEHARAGDRDAAHQAANTRDARREGVLEALAADRADLAGGEEAGGRGVREHAREQRRVVIGDAEHRRARDRCSVKHSAPAGASPPSAARRACRPSSRSRSALRASRACRRTTWPACTSSPSAIEPLSVSAPTTPRTRKSPCSYSGLPASITIPSSRPLRIRRWSRSSSSSKTSRSLTSAGLPASSWIDASLGARDRQLRAQRRGALRHARRHRHALEDQADRALLEHELVAEERRAALEGAPARLPAQHRHRAAGLAQRTSSASRVEGVGVGQHDRPARAARASGTPASITVSVASPSAPRGRVEGAHGAVARAPRPHRDGRARLDLLARARARRSRRSRPAPRGAAPRGRPPGAPPGPPGASRRRTPPRRPPARPRARRAASCAASMAAAARVVAVRERGADADRHGGHDTERDEGARDRAVRADGGRQDRGRDRARDAPARARRAPGRRFRRRAAGLPRASRRSPASRRAEQQRELEHRLVSFLPVDARFSVAEYAALAHAQIDELLAAGATPIVVGGTGLYLRAALTELSLRPPPPPGVRERWNAELERRGPQALHALLARARAVGRGGDRSRRPPPDRARARARGDRRARAARRATRSCGASDMRHPTRLVGLVMDREALYARIDRRVDEMVAAGVIEEVRAAHRAGASSTARAALGFDELLGGRRRGDEAPHAATTPSAS